MATDTLPVPTPAPALPERVQAEITRAVDYAARASAEATRRAYDHD